MATLEERVATLEQTTITRTQAQALVDALGTDHTTLSQTITELEAIVNNLKAKLQALQNRVTDTGDHEARITALEP